MASIGTPLSTTATKVVLCGSGELGKEVVIELQRLGVEVIAVDRYENAPAMQVAHRSYTLNMLDGTALREIIENEKGEKIRITETVVAGARGMKTVQTKEEVVFKPETTVKTPRGEMTVPGQGEDVEVGHVDEKKEERKPPQLSLSHLDFMKPTHQLQLGLRRERKK